MPEIMQQEVLSDGVVRIVFTQPVTAELEDEVSTRLKAIEGPSGLIVDCEHLGACRTSIIAALLGLSRRYSPIVLENVPELMRDTIDVMHLNAFFDVRPAVS